MDKDLGFGSRMEVNDHKSDQYMVSGVSMVRPTNESEITDLGVTWELRANY